MFKHTKKTEYFKHRRQTIIYSTTTKTIFSHTQQRVYKLKVLPVQIPQICTPRDFVKTMSHIVEHVDKEN